MFCYFFCFKQKTAYEMRISDWSSDVCSSDLAQQGGVAQFLAGERYGLPGDRRVFGGGGEIGVEGEGTLLVVDGDGVGAERCQQRAAGHLVPGGCEIRRQAPAEAVVPRLRLVKAPLPAPHPRHIGKIGTAASME